MRLPQRSERGFTLIEVLVVMLIIGILSAIAVPIYMNQQKTARQLTVRSDMNNALVLVSSMKQYGGYPSTLPPDAKASPGVVLSITTTPGGVDTCIQGHHTTTPTMKYRITPKTKKVQLGTCS